MNGNFTPRVVYFVVNLLAAELIMLWKEKNRYADIEHRNRLL